MVLIRKAYETQAAGDVSLPNSQDPLISIADYEQ